MIAEENTDGKWSEKKMGKEDGLRTVECLRGRLIAERSASRKAKEDVELMGNKLIELETKLKEEIKSRNKAEKKLSFLKKKLESMNISYVSDESQYSSLFDKSEISSVTSTTASSSTKNSDEKEQNSQFQDSVGSRKCSSEYLVDNSQELTSQEYSINFEKNALQMTIFSKDDDSLSKGGQLGKASELELSNSDVNSSKSSSQEEGENGEDERDFQEDNVNNSLALVLVDLPKPKETIDPIVLDATVREALDALKHAKEKLQTRMKRERTIKVG